MQPKVHASEYNVTWMYLAGGLVAHSPYLSVSGGGLSDDGAGLGRGQSLLDHYAGVMVGHP